MDLLTIIDNSRTDKNTIHSYLETYEKLFKNKRYTSKAIMEIGISNDGSIKLWHDYFSNANIFGLDIMKMRTSINDIKNNYPRINLLLEIDAYNMDVNFFKKKFDIIIEDGDHVLSNQIKFLKKYLPILEDDGIMVIEDIQNIEDIEILSYATPEEYKKYIEVYDLRGNKGRYDDILFVINKNKIENKIENNRFNLFINLYDKIFSSFKESKVSLLEIVNDKNNDNLLWKEYLKNGEIYEINKNDAYNNEIILKRFNNKKFNIIIENGSYDLNSLIKFIKIYINLLTNNGILLIKNIQSVRYLQILINSTPFIYHNFIEAYDLREVYDNYNDVFFIINKINEPSIEPINEPSIEPVNETSIEPVNEPINEPSIEPVNETSIEPVNETSIEPVNETSIEPSIETSIETSIEPVNETSIEPSIEHHKEFKKIYNLLFRRIKDEEMILLNIGLNEDMIRYLLNTFNKSILFGIGIKQNVADDIKNNNRVKLYLGTSPFDINLESSNIKFNVIILNYEKEIQKIIFIINTYSKILNKNGILIIEDVEEQDIPKIRENINQELKDIMETYKENNKNIIIINI